MNFVLAVLLGLAHAAPARDPLAEALHGLRGHVRFSDASAEGRLFRHGAGLFTTGVGGLFMLISAADGATGAMAVPFVAAFVGAAGAVAVGTVEYVAGRFILRAAPRPRLKIESAREFMSAPGMNQFMRLSYDEQYAWAAGDADFATFLIKLNQAYGTASKYHLLPPQDVF